MRTSTRPTPAKDALLEAACSLFYTNGIRGTSIEIILERAGVARQSLYQHFESKDGLVAAFLNLRDERWCGWMNDFVAAASDDPLEQVFAIYDFLEDWFAQSDFSGCAFINTAAEYSNPEHPFHVLAARHKARVLGDIERLCKAAKLPEHKALAKQLALLMEGAIVTEQVTPGSGAAAEAKAIARILIQSRPQPTRSKK
ncbi:MAG TPA: TetR/AcrR family transcriptional regulator [Rhodocyclaceae bacterium]|jgi:AcrR family transcriptional regulator|nr:TetR/AcrR family transcriptional regulator [Rhodocyclaceae bacterium]